MFGTSDVGGVLSEDMDEKSKVVTITVDEERSASLFAHGDFLAIASGIAHEGDHGVTDRADPANAHTISRSILMSQELSGYRAGAYVYSALGIDSPHAGWTKYVPAPPYGYLPPVFQGGYFNEFQLRALANNSVRAICSRIKCND